MGPSIIYPDSPPPKCDKKKYHENTKNKINFGSIPYDHRFSQAIKTKTQQISSIAFTLRRFNHLPSYIFWFSAATKAKAVEIFSKC